MLGCVGGAADEALAFLSAYTIPLVGALRLINSVSVSLPSNPTFPIHVDQRVCLCFPGERLSLHFGVVGFQRHVQRHDAPALPECWQLDAAFGELRRDLWGATAVECPVVAKYWLGVSNSHLRLRTYFVCWSAESPPGIRVFDWCLYLVSLMHQDSDCYLCSFLLLYFLFHFLFTCRFSGVIYVKTGNEPALMAVSLVFLNTFES